MGKGTYNHTKDTVLWDNSSAVKPKKIFQNRVPACPLEDIYIIEACIADPIYLRYIQHINKGKQRQGDLSLFSRLLLTFLLIIFFWGDLKCGAEISAQGLEAADGGRGCGGEGCEVR